MKALEVLAPVFLMIVVGIALKAIRFLTPAMIESCNRLVYWIGVPSLLFVEGARAGGALESQRLGIAAALLATIACLLLGYAVAFALRLPLQSRGAFVQGGFRGNLAFIGFAVLTFSFPGREFEAGRQAIVIMTIMILFYNVASVAVLVAGRKGGGRGTAMNVMGELAVNPLIMGCVLGLLYGRAGWTLNIVAERTLEGLGQFGLPLALISIGGSLHLEMMKKGFVAILGSALIKNVAGPAFGWLFIKWLGIEGDTARIILILMATPTAAQAYVMADQLGGDKDLAAGEIAMSTILSMGSLSWALLVDI